MILTLQSKYYRFNPIFSVFAGEIEKASLCTDAPCETTQFLISAINRWSTRLKANKISSRRAHPKRQRKWANNRMYQLPVQNILNQFWRFKHNFLPSFFLFVNSDSILHTGLVVSLAWVFWLSTLGRFGLAHFRAELASLLHSAHFFFFTLALP